MRTSQQSSQRRVFCAITLITLSAMILLSCSQSVVAQWSTSGNDISNTNSGNVGVGTATPESKLTVQSTGADTAGEKYFRIKNTNSYAGLLIDPGQAGDAKWLILGGLPNAGDFTIREYGVGNYLTIRKTTGRIGIGTSSLDNGKLTVQQAADSILAVFRVEQLQGANSRGAYVAFGGGADGTTSRGFLGFGKSGTGGATLFTNEFANSFSVRSEGALHLGTGGDNIRMTLDTTGNVNIGSTTSTGARLYVFGGNDAGTANGIHLSSADGSTSEFGFFNTSASADYLRLGYWTGSALKNVFFDVGTTGKVGIGTNAPTTVLDVAGQIRSSSGGFKFPDGTVQTTAAGGGGGSITGVGAGAGLTGGGASGSVTLDIGAGSGLSVAADSVSVNYGSTSGTAVQGNTAITVSPGAGMSGGGAITLGAGGSVTLTNADTGSSQPIFKNIANAAGAAQFAAGSNNDALRFEGTGGTSISFDNATKKVIINSSTSGSSLSAADVSAGQFGQNTGNGNYTFPGNLTVNGNIAAKYQDVAEWVPAAHTLPAGTVTVLNPNQSNQVMASAQAYDTRVAGVISESPGLTLGEAGANKVLVATTGRVRVKVDATRGPIHVGDLLVTSDIEGVAMKSEPLSLGGVPIHRPGTLIGKALEPLAKGKGEILVLLSLQ